MARYLRHFGLDPQIYIPDRIFEGYGPNIAAIDKLIDAMSDLDSLTVHSRREAGQLRASVHFKSR